jgi:hypothetical protein
MGGREVWEEEEDGRKNRMEDEGGRGKDVMMKRIVRVYGGIWLYI